MDELELTEQQRAKLDNIVAQMIQNKESDSDIQFVVDDFKSKYGSPKSAEPSTQGGESGSVKPQTPPSTSTSPSDLTKLGSLGQQILPKSLKETTEAPAKKPASYQPLVKSQDQLNFEEFYKTLPSNLKNSENYNLKGYWESLGKPKAFDYSQPKERDGYYHAFSRNPNTGEILKSENHPTFKQALMEDEKAGYKAYKSPEGKVYTFGEDDVVPSGYKPYDWKKAPEPKKEDTKYVGEEKRNAIDNFLKKLPTKDNIKATQLEEPKTIAEKDARKIILQRTVEQQAGSKTAFEYENAQEKAALQYGLNLGKQIEAEELENKKKQEESRRKIEDASGWLRTYPKGDLLLANDDERDIEIETLRDRYNMSESEAMSAMENNDKKLFDIKAERTANEIKEDIYNRLSDRMKAPTWAQEAGIVPKEVQAFTPFLKPTKEQVELEYMNMAKQQAVNDMDSSDREAYQKNIELYDLIEANSKNPSQANIAKINILKAQIGDLTNNPKMWYDPITGKNITKPTPAAKEYRQNLNEAAQQIAETTTEDKLAEMFQDSYAKYMYAKKLYNTNQKWLASSVGSLDQAKNIDIKQAERLKDLYVKAKSEFEAVSKAYLLNRDPAGVEKTFGSVEQFFKFTGEKIAKEVIPSILTPEGMLTGTNEQFVRNIENLANDYDVELTDAQKDRFKHTFGENVTEGVVGIAGLLPKLWLGNQVAGVIETGLAIDKAIKLWSTGTKLEKGLAFVTKGIIEEAKMQGVGFAGGVGAGFYLSHGLKIPRLSGKYGAILQPFVDKIIQGSVGGTVGMEAGEIVHAAVEAMNRDESFKDKMDELFPNVSESTKRIAEELVINSVMGLPHLKKTDFSSSPEKLRKAAKELKDKGYDQEADQIIKKAKQIEGLKDVMTEDQVKVSKMFIEANRQLELDKNKNRLKEKYVWTSNKTVEDEINQRHDAALADLDKQKVSITKTEFDSKVAEINDRRKAELDKNKDRLSEKHSAETGETVEQNINSKYDAEINKLSKYKIVSEPPKKEEEKAQPKVDLQKYTGGTPEKFGYIDRGDGKGKVELTQEEFEAEQAKIKQDQELGEDISSLPDDEKIVLTVKNLDEIPEQFRDRAVKKGTPAVVRKKIFGLPIGKKSTITIGEGYSYEITGKEAKEYARSLAEAGVKAEGEQETVITDPLKDVESTAKALDKIGRDEKGNLTQTFLDIDKKSWGKRAKVADEDLFNKEQTSYIRQLAYDYHKAKADGSNPQLVEAVEKLLKPTKDEQETKKENGEPMPTGVQGVRTEGEGGQESTELRTEKEKVSGGLTQEEKTNLETIAKETGVNFQEVRNVYNKYGEGKPLSEITLEDYQKAQEKRQKGGTEEKVPPAGKRLFNEPNPETVEISKQFKKDNGIDTPEGERITEIDEENSKRIADAYEEMEDSPDDPIVQKAYEELADQTAEQHKSIMDAGYEVELWEGEGEPYKNAQEMIDDLRNNKHMYIFSTEAGFGENPITDKQRKQNKMLQDSGFKDKNGKPLLYNDVFRFVHDFFGHSERGNAFGAKGEENAWDVHYRMYKSPLARRALTTETRGQNSWVNFGKHLRNPDGSIKTAKDQGYISPKDRPFAEQKMGLLPEWASENKYLEKDLEKQKAEKPEAEKEGEPTKTKKDAVQEPSTEKEVPRTGEGGKDLAEGGEGVGQGKQGEKAPQKSPKEVIQDYVDAFERVTSPESTGAEKRAATEKMRDMLDENPNIKRIFDNIKSIHKSLEQQGLISKTKGCP